MCNVAIIGTGIVGSAVARSLKLKGYNITGVFSKTKEKALLLESDLGCIVAEAPGDLLEKAEVIFITTYDREIGGIASVLAQTGSVKTKQTFFHMSGALSSEILNPLKEKGAATGSIHPLQSFASVEKAIKNLPGTFFAVQGDDQASDLADRIVRDLGGTAFTVNIKDRMLYHLGACVASNYLVAITHFAVSIFRQIGMSSEQANRALMPLIVGTVSNISELGPVKALTGPVARGDVGTVEQHLKTLESQKLILAEVYKALGCYTTGVAVEKGSIDKFGAEQLMNIFRKGDEKVGE